MRLLSTLVVLGLLSTLTAGQTLQLNAGTSTLFGGTGGGLVAYFPSNTLSLSGGISQGHPTIGVSDHFKFRDVDVLAGSQNFNGSVEGGGLFLSGVGVSFHRGDQNRSMAGFVGSSGVGYTTPYYSGTTPQHIGAAFYFQQTLSPHWKVGMLTAVDAGHKTGVTSAAYTRGTWRLSGAGGVLNNSKYVTGTGEWTPIRALHFSASHQDSFDTIVGRVVHAKSDSAAVFASVSRFTANAVVIHSAADGRPIVGFSAGVGTHVAFVDVRADLYRSGIYQSLNYTAREHLGRRFYVSETVTQSQSQAKTLATSFGGGVQTNRFSASIDHTAVFVPFNIAGQAGFQQVTSVSLNFRVRDAMVSLAGYIPTQGKLKYTAYGNDYTRGPLASGVRAKEFHVAGGRYVIQGVVKDSKTGEAVEGVAVQIGKQMTFSTSSGVVFTRSKHQRAVTIRVSPEDYASSGRMRVVHAPDTVTPGETFEIIVEMF